MARQATTHAGTTVVSVADFVAYADRRSRRAAEAERRSETPPPSKIARQLERNRRAKAKSARKASATS